jgi:hypothetical protein
LIRLAAVAFAGWLLWGVLGVVWIEWRAGNLSLRRWTPGTLGRRWAVGVGLVVASLVVARVPEHFAFAAAASST